MCLDTQLGYGDCGYLMPTRGVCAFKTYYFKEKSRQGE